MNKPSHAIPALKDCLTAGELNLNDMLMFRHREYNNLPKRNREIMQKNYAEIGIFKMTQLVPRILAQVKGVVRQKVLWPRFVRNVRH